MNSYELAKRICDCVSIPYRYGTTVMQSENRIMFEDNVSIPHRYGTTVKEELSSGNVQVFQFLIGTVQQPISRHL